MQQDRDTSNETPGGIPPREVEDRPTVGTTTPDAYPDDRKRATLNSGDSDDSGTEGVSTRPSDDDPGKEQVEGGEAAGDSWSSDSENDRSE